ncbi:MULTISPECIES: hypothetical protein [Micromonospora]|uniref:hypothetical protein n=1 Tax=Micromonospora TaxID=1873 RepID=UPI000EF581D8|nr:MULTISPECIES: hypothetical protein [Micromonospora]KAB1907842.1 hypothetical protein F8279_09075 [Micromonospora sp. AMSO1212t]MDO3687118.1 hypothetical protein [Micromonospora sp. C28ISP2-4]RLP99896.1 hypothetical protein EAD96_26535 [Micromonospora sp. BL1]
MTTEEPPVRLVLDRSALVGYVAGSMHVAEPLHEVAHDGVRFGVPAVVVAEALAVIDEPGDRAVLHRLLERPACAVLPTWGEDWQELAYWRRITGRVDLAAAVMAVLDHDASVLTSEGKAYGDGGDLPVIAFPG